MRHDQVHEPSFHRENQSATRWGGMPLDPCKITLKDSAPESIPVERTGAVSEPEFEIVTKARRRCGIGVAP